MIFLVGKAVPGQL